VTENLWPGGVGAVVALSWGTNAKIQAETSKKAVTGPVAPIGHACVGVHCGVEASGAGERKRKRKKKKEKKKEKKKRN